MPGGAASVSGCGAPPEAAAAALPSLPPGKRARPKAQQGVGWGWGIALPLTLTADIRIWGYQDITSLRDLMVPNNWLLACCAFHGYNSSNREMCVSSDYFPTARCIQCFSGNIQRGNIKLFWFQSADWDWEFLNLCFEQIAICAGWIENINPIINMQLTYSQSARSYSVARQIRLFQYQSQKLICRLRLIIRRLRIVLFNLQSADWDCTTLQSYSVMHTFLICSQNDCGI